MSIKFIHCEDDDADAKVGVTCESKTKIAKMAKEGSFGLELYSSDVKINFSE